MNPGIIVVAEIGGSLNHNSLAQDQWICSIVNKGWFSQISHLSLMNLNSNVTHFSTVTSFCLLSSFFFFFTEERYQWIIAGSRFPL